MLLVERDDYAPVCGICPYCGEDIYEGDDIIVLDNEKQYHEDCFYDIAVSILLERGIAETATAEAEHPEWDLAIDESIERRMTV